MDFALHIVIDGIARTFLAGEQRLGDHPTGILHAFDSCPQTAESGHS
jgi:hypothetical protein